MVVISALMAMLGFVSGLMLSLVLSWWLAPSAGYEKVLPWLLAAAVVGAVALPWGWSRVRKRRDAQRVDQA